ncbi:hypothetical protein V6N13_133431 [Hibiscus sabdariffa]
MGCPSAETMGKIKATSDELRDLLKAEELFFQQKSRVQYVKEGDQNFAFFFRQFDDISREFVHFFYNSLGAVEHDVTEISDVLLNDILGVGLTEDMCEGLIAPVLRREIKDVLFAMNGNKAPGVDGYTSKFFQVAWGVVGDDVGKGVQYFFERCVLPEGFNSTVITLVPKVFAPMWLLSSLILPNHGGFLTGRDIVDNVLLARELVNGYGRQRMSPRGTLLPF